MTSRFHLSHRLTQPTYSAARMQVLDLGLEKKAIASQVPLGFEEHRSTLYIKALDLHDVVGKCRSSVNE